MNFTDIYNFINEHALWFWTATGIIVVLSILLWVALHVYYQRRDAPQKQVIDWPPTYAEILAASDTPQEENSQLES